MRDGHIHFHNQPYTLDTIADMVVTAMDKGIDEIWLLDHTHKFKEFDFLYKYITDQETLDWYNGAKGDISIKEYLDFVDLVKGLEWPIKIKFGLEVCYFPECEEELKKAMDSIVDLDFYIGSVHYALGAGIDINKKIQEQFNIDELYIDYFDRLKKAVRSGLFDVIGHPGLIKLFGLLPDKELHSRLIEELAIECSKHMQRVENNTGSLRHGYPYGGMSPEMLRAFLKHNVKFHKSSDAHTYKDIGRAFDSIIENTI